ncbi:MAG: hypothetical protein O2894_04705 [Planctomycetota bacterium]|nr:hypothetical protein [Planctomycetota bacterium]
MLRCLAPLLALVVVSVLLHPARSARADDAPSVGEVALLMDAALPLEQRCELRYLLHLGWRFVRDPGVNEVVVDGGWPCRFRTLERAQAAGALTIRVPTAFGANGARTLGPRLAAIADAPASRCAYQHRLAPALRRGIGRYVEGTESGRYQFPKLFDLVHSPVWGLRLPEHEWTKHDRVYHATYSSRAAMEALWRRGGIVECYTGQWLAIFGGQYELYGGPWFDEVFAPGDLQIGAPEPIKPSPLGRTTRGEGPYPYRALLIPESQRSEDAVLSLAPYGPMAFVGLSGIMENQSANERTNENFVVTQVSPAALQALVDGGGLSFLRAGATKVWEHVNASVGLIRLLSEPSGEHLAAIDRILASPAFSEIWVYVHPLGIVTFADLVRGKFNDTDSPVEFRFYLYGREDFLYRRYHAAWKARCAQGAPPACPAR